MRWTKVSKISTGLALGASLLFLSPLSSQARGSGGGIPALPVEVEAGFVMFGRGELEEAGRLWAELGARLTRNGAADRQVAWVYVLATAAFERQGNPQAYETWAISISRFLRVGRAWEEEAKTLKRHVDALHQGLQAAPADAGPPSIRPAEAMLLALEKGLSLSSFEGPRPGLRSGEQGPGPKIDASRGYVPRPLALAAAACPEGSEACTPRVPVAPEEDGAVDAQASVAGPRVPIPEGLLPEAGDAGTLGEVGEDLAGVAEDAKTVGGQELRASLAGPPAGELTLPSAKVSEPESPETIETGPVVPEPVVPEPVAPETEAAESAVSGFTFNQLPASAAPVGGSEADPRPAVAEAMQPEAQEGEIRTLVPRRGLPEDILTAEVEDGLEDSSGSLEEEPASPDPEESRGAGALSGRVVFFGEPSDEVPSHAGTRARPSVEEDSPTELPSLTFGIWEDEGGEDPPVSGPEPPRELPREVTVADFDPTSEAEEAAAESAPGSRALEADVPTKNADTEPVPRDALDLAIGPRSTVEDPVAGPLVGALVEGNGAEAVLGGESNGEAAVEGVASSQSEPSGLPGEGGAASTLDGSTSPLDVPTSPLTLGQLLTSPPASETLEERELTYPRGSEPPGASEESSPRLVYARPEGAEPGLSSDEMAMARRAWRYIQSNRQPMTGMVSSVEGYPYLTMWDLGSTLASFVCAGRLGLMSRAQTLADLELLLETMRYMPLYQDELPNREYHAATARMTDFSNRETEMGTGWSALDVGRLLIWMRLTAEWYPEAGDTVRAIVGRFSFDRLGRRGQMNGALWANGSERIYQEGRLGYEQYAAMGFLLWGLDLPQALDYADSAEARVEGIPIRYDLRDRPYLGSEAFIMAAIELGGIEPRFRRQVEAMYAVQKKRYEEEGIVTAVSEDSVNRKPWFVYNNVYYQGSPWRAVDHKGRAVQGMAALSTKAAFGWSVLFPGEVYSRILSQSVSDLYHPRRGFFAGRYERGEVNRSLNLNTNALVLEALLFLHQGNQPFLQVDPAVQASLGLHPLEQEEIHGP